MSKSNDTLITKEKRWLSLSVIQTQTDSLNKPDILSQVFKEKSSPASQEYILLPLPLNHKGESCISKDAQTALLQAPVSASPLHCKPPPCVSLFIFLFWITKHRANKAQTVRRTRLPLASPGASASPCQCWPSHWGQEPLWSEASSTQEQHAERQHFASTRAPYGHDCLCNMMLYVFLVS